MLKQTKENEIIAPRPYDLMWPTLKALKALGGSASNQELVDKIIEVEAYPEEIQKIPHKEGRKTQIEYNAAWARTHLKRVSAINNDGAKGVWVLLDSGDDLLEADMEKIFLASRKIKSENRKRKKDHADVKKNVDLDSSKDADLNEDEINTDDWKDQLLEKLYGIDPYDFEKLCQLVLRESGFIKVEVTKKSGDGGIDGVGILRVNLLSFHVSFQCKRYKSSVGAGDIRDFRGAFVGRGDKGLFITTGTFTSEARKEANRDGAPAIDLIDGEDLCDLLKNLKLGVKTEFIEKVTINDEWFYKI